MILQLLMLLQHFSSCHSEILTASANEMMNMSWSPPCCVNLRNTGRSSSTSWCSHHHASLKNWAQCLVFHSDSTVRSLAWGWRAEKIVLLMVVCGTFSLLPCCWAESMMWDLRRFTSPEMISCCSMSMLRKQVLCVGCFRSLLQVCFSIHVMFVPENFRNLMKFALEHVVQHLNLELIYLIIC